MVIMLRHLIIFIFISKCYGMCGQLARSGDIEYTPVFAIDEYSPNGLDTYYKKLIDLKQDKNPIKNMTVCLWAKIFGSRGTIFTILNPKTYDTIFALKAVPDNIETNFMSDTNKKIKIFRGEWMHICVFYKIAELLVTTKSPCVNQTDTVVFSAEPLNFGVLTSLLFTIGAPPESDQPHSLVSEFADVRLYWESLNKKEVENVSEFKYIAKEYIQILTKENVNDTELEIKVKQNENKQIANSFFSLPVSEFSGSCKEYILWFFDVEISCNDAKITCQRFNGSIPVSNDPNFLQLLEDYSKRSCSKIESFWLFNAEKNMCETGIYKSHKVFATTGNKSDIATFCLIPKRQIFYLESQFFIREFTPLPYRELEFKNRNHYLKVVYYPIIKKMHLMNYRFNKTLKETFMFKMTNILGRYTWKLINHETDERVRLIFSVCGEGNFTCSNGDCIEMDKVCDFNNDCSDHSDEENCGGGCLPPISYDKRIAPTKMTRVALELQLIHITEINVSDNSMTLTLKLTVSWRDNRLTFKFLIPKNLTKVCRDISKSFWHPRITLLNAKATDSNLFHLDDFNGITSAYLDSNSTRKISVIDGYNIYSHEGKDVEIFHEKTEEVTFLCDFNLFKYPFDDQNCQIHLLLESLVIPDSYWNLENISILSDQKAVPSLYKELSFSFSKVLENGRQLEINFNILRKNTAFIFNIFLPCVILEIIGLSSFTMPESNYSDRITITLSSLIVMAALFTQISSSLPTSAEPKLIDIWMFGHVFALFTVFLFNISVILFHYKLSSKEEEGCHREEAKIFSFMEKFNQRPKSLVKNIIKVQPNYDDEKPGKEYNPSNANRIWKSFGNVNKFGLVISIIGYLVFLSAFYFFTFSQK